VCVRVRVCVKAYQRGVCIHVALSISVYSRSHRAHTPIHAPRHALSHTHTHTRTQTHHKRRFAGERGHRRRRKDWARRRILGRPASDRLGDEGGQADHNGSKNERTAQHCLDFGLFHGMSKVFEVLMFTFASHHRIALYYQPDFRVKIERHPVF